MNPKTRSWQNDGWNRYQHRRSRDLGAAFEEQIEKACEYYRMNGVADIEKTPEPMRVIQDFGNGRFLAFFEKRAQPDFKGFLIGGRAIHFEAKCTESEKMQKSRVSNQQAERLERACRYGAISFVLCAFHMNAVYRIPWELWRNMEGKFGRKFFVEKDVEQYRIPIARNGIPLFLTKITQERGNYL